MSDCSIAGSMAVVHVPWNQVREPVQLVALGKARVVWLSHKPHTHAEWYLNQ